MISALVLVAFIKLLFVTDSPRFVAGLYTALAAGGAILAVAGGEASILVALVQLVLCSAIAFAYFWGLLHIEPWTGTWWAVAVAGALLVAFIV